MTKGKNLPVNPQNTLQVAASNFSEPEILRQLDIAIGKREIQILRHVAMGESTCTISENLCISTRTVETHRKNLLKKLGAKNTANLIYRAMTLGLL